MYEINYFLYEYISTLFLLVTMRNRLNTSFYCAIELSGLLCDTWTNQKSVFTDSCSQTHVYMIVSQQTSAMAYRVHTVLEPKGSGCWGSRPPRNFLLQMVIFPPLITGSGIFTTKLKTNWVFFINLYLVRTLLMGLCKTFVLPQFSLKDLRMVGSSCINTFEKYNCSS